MTKEEQFLWIVQTVILRNAINLATDPDRLEEHRTEVSATGAYIVCDEAIRASMMIPASMTASEAAHQFLFYMLDNLRESDENATGEKVTVPAWFARGYKKSVYSDRGIRRV